MSAECVPYLTVRHQRRSRATEKTETERQDERQREKRGAVLGTAELYLLINLIL